LALGGMDPWEADEDWERRRAAGEDVSTWESKTAIFLLHLFAYTGLGVIIWIGGIVLGIFPPVK
jgi:hypothetical protein